jgi:hypothetical protein
VLELARLGMVVWGTSFPCRMLILRSKKHNVYNIEKDGIHFVSQQQTYQ